MAATYYITTAIDYVNGPPHMGHAYEKIAADAIARYHRLRGNDVFFLTGTDEHGLKIERAAQSAGHSPQAFTDTIVEAFKETWGALGVSYDGFIRTTDPGHCRAVQGIFQRLLDQGDIYKATYEGLYCKGCEEFKNERELAEGKCPVHQADCEYVSEENYVFKLSAYRERIRDHIQNNPSFIQPEFRQREVLNLLETFPDVSVSRQSVRWGIPVPGDESQVIYVWIDALSNYLTGIGYPDAEGFRRYWPADCHMVGKDIMKFHAIIWPALLMALDVPLPKQIYGHGWVLTGGQKMGKSTGNVVEPRAFAAEYGADALRYYLLREIQFGRDGELTQEAFENRVNADLANNLGNALNRLLPILEKNFEGRVPARVDDEIAFESDATAYPQSSLRISFPGWIRESQLPRYESAMAELRLHDALASIWEILDALNKYIDRRAPWALAKAGDHEALGQVCYTVLESLRQVAILTSPFIPTLAGKIWEQLGIETTLADQRWDDLSWGGLREGTQTQRLGPIYPRIGAELAGAKKKQ